jgi:RNA polymerase sigma factor (sigma-70 family)
MAVTHGWRARVGHGQRRWLAQVAATLALTGPKPGTASRTLAASEAAFEAFFRRHERDIFKYVWRMTGEEQAAYDLSQETFVRAWKHYERIGRYEVPRAWLFRVATNLALNYRRSRAAEPLALGVEAADECFVQSDPRLRALDDDSVRRTLVALPGRQRAALILRAVYGMSCAEVAEALGMSRDAAKMLLFRGREAFRTIYGREGGTR